MFYLAHLYLSENCIYTMVGDFVTKAQRNWRRDDCDSRYLNGVRLHNAIEEFSENHPIVKRSQARFSKNAKLSEKSLFVFYDHLLAANWEKYSDTSLADFSSNAYKIFMEHHLIFPYKLKRMLPSMIKNNWLIQFKTVGGMNKSYQQMGKLSARPWNIDACIEDFIANYSLFKEDFDEFFPLLINHVKSIQADSDNILKLPVEEEADFKNSESKESLILKLA